MDLRHGQSQLHMIHNFKPIRLHIFGIECGIFFEVTGFSENASMKIHQKIKFKGHWVKVLYFSMEIVVDGVQNLDLSKVFNMYHFEAIVKLDASNFKKTSKNC